MPALPRQQAPGGTLPHGHIAAYTTVGPLLSLALALGIVRHPGVYNRRRTRLLAALKLLRCCFFYFCYQPNERLILPLARTPTQQWLQLMVKVRAGAEPDCSPCCWLCC